MRALLAERAVLGGSALLAVMIVGGAAWAMYCALPRTPSAVRLYGVPGDGRVTLSWKPGRTAERVTSWQFRRRVEGRSYGDWLALSGSRIVEGLTNGRRYGFRVRGENAHGAGAHSNEVTVVPLSSVVLDVTAGDLVQAVVDARSEIVEGVEVVRKGVASARAIEASAAQISDQLEGMIRSLAEKGRRASEQGGGGGGATEVSVEREVLPVHLRVHFENAQLNPHSGGLSGEGIRLTSMQRSLLLATANTLDGCATESSVVRIKPYGFASSAAFSGMSNSDELNLAVANGRAEAVHRALVRMGTDGNLNLRVEAPSAWRSFDEMVGARDRCVTTSGEGRNSFPGRVVVLQVEEWGACTLARGEILTPSCEA